MSKYTNKWVEFLNGANTVIISNQQDFISFKSLIKKVGLEFNYDDYYSLHHIAKINDCIINYSIVLVEYQPYKGFSIGYKSFEESEKWYGQSPWTIDEIREDLK